MRQKMYSLNTKLFIFMSYGVLVAVAIYLLTNIVSGYVIDATYKSEESQRERCENYIASLQSFIDENELSTQDVNDIANWVRSERYVYLMIYDKEELLLSFDNFDQVDDPFNMSGGLTVEFPDKKELAEYAEANGIYPIELSDATLYASITDFTEYIYYDFWNITGLLLAMIALVAIMMLFFRDVAGRITQLAKDVSVVSAGNTSHSIAFSGEDEISKLSENVENMRTSMLENIDKEKEAIEANTQLITSLSHDIRTPLTVLLGYLDIMKMHTEDEAMASYLAASQKTAMRLKDLSDDIFQYFLVFGGELDTNIQEYEAGALLEQLLSEHLLLMTERGYTIESEHSGIEGLIMKTDAPKLMRILDNIFSNLQKYSDPTSPVKLCIEGKEDNIAIRFANKVLERPNAESTGIGLKTCQKIAKSLGIIFESCRDGNEFATSIIIPASQAPADLEAKA